MQSPFVYLPIFFLCFVAIMALRWYRANLQVRQWVAHLGCKLDGSEYPVSLLDLMRLPVICHVNVICVQGQRKIFKLSVGSYLGGLIFGEINVLSE
jgi:hypothetical protein